MVTLTISSFIIYTIKVHRHAFALMIYILFIAHMSYRKYVRNLYGMSAPQINEKSTLENKLGLASWVWLLIITKEEMQAQPMAVGCKYEISPATGKLYYVGSV